MLAGDCDRALELTPAGCAGSFSCAAELAQATWLKRPGLSYATWLARQRYKVANTDQEHSGTYSKVSAWGRQVSSSAVAIGSMTSSHSGSIRINT